MTMNKELMNIFSQNLGVQNFNSLKIWIIIIDILINEDADNPEDAFSDEVNLKDELYRLMGILDDREKNIIIDYYGIQETPMTLQEIGNTLSLTKERVRQIKEKALRKLRNESYDLLEYLSE